MKFINHTTKFALILVGTLLNACSGTGKYLEQPELSIMGSQKNTRETINELFSEQQPYIIQLCEADPAGKNCILDDGGISASGIGGIGLPLFLDMTGVEVNNLTAEDDAWSFDSKLDAAINKIPPWCGTVDGKITMKSDNAAGIEIANFFCNWVVIGNVITNVDLSIDSISSAERTFTGYYKLTFFGTDNGVGSGYYKAVIVPKTDQSKL
jgi:hypothetical protein